MDPLQILHDNYKAENGSFLFYLHEENHFDEAAFSSLCECITALSCSCAEAKAVWRQLSFIYGQVLKHIIYHFDPSDHSKIPDLPQDYSEKLEVLECAVMQYFS